MPNVSKIQATIDAAMFSTSISHRFDISSEALEHILNRTIVTNETLTKKPQFFFCLLKIIPLNFLF